MWLLKQKERFVMFNFILGVLLGATSLYYYSEKVGPKCRATNAEILELLRNKALLKQYVAREIKRMQITGELEQYLLNVDNVIDSSNINLYDPRNEEIIIDNYSSK